MQKMEGASCDFPVKKHQGQECWHYDWEIGGRDMATPVDEELAKDPTVDQMSPSYNIQLNNRIAERLESLDKGINK